MAKSKFFTHKFDRYLSACAKVTNKEEVAKALDTMSNSIVKSGVSGAAEIIAASFLVNGLLSKIDKQVRASN